MEILLEKTRKPINLKADIISRNPNSCYSYEIRTNCTQSKARGLYNKHIRPLIDRINAYHGGMRNIVDLRIVPYGLGGFIEEGDPERGRSIGILFWDPILDGIPDDLVFHHGSYNLYITEITNEAGIEMVKTEIFKHEEESK